MSKSKLDTRDVHTIITDQWIEHFDLGEQEDEKYAKNYTSGFADDSTDTGTNNAFWRLSILMRYGAYCKTAEQQLAKSHERVDKLAEQLAKNETEKLLDAYECAEVSIVNCEKELVIFRDLFEHTYGEQWMGATAYSEKLDEAFNPKVLGSGSATPPSERSEQVWLKIRARKSGRSVDEQKVFEHNVFEFVKKNGGELLNTKIATLPKKEAQDMLNDAINTVAKQDADKDVA